MADEPMPSFLVEYPCERRCTVEYDLAIAKVRWPALEGGTR